MRRAALNARGGAVADGAGADVDASGAPGGGPLLALRAPGHWLMVAPEPQLFALLAIALAAPFAGLVATRGAPGGPSPPYRVLREVMAGGMSAAIGEVVLLPLEVVKVRIQARRASAGDDSGVRATAAAIWRRHGAAGLWAPGLVAGVLRALLYQV